MSKMYFDKSPEWTMAEYENEKQLAKNKINMIALHGTNKENTEGLELAKAKYEWELSLKELHTAINKVLDDGVEVRQKIIRIMKELRK